MTRLTTSSYVKILLVVLLCVVLCGGIVGCSRGCSMATQHANDIFWQTYDSYDLAQKGDGSVRARDVKDLQIDWAAGSVVIETRADETADDAAITFTETNGASLPESQRMRWELSGDVLQISFGPRDYGFIGCSPLARKNLVVSIPESVANDLGCIGINGASGSYEIGQIGCELLDINLASGQVNADIVRTDTLALDVASGNVDIAGNIAQQLDVELASGMIALDCGEACPRIASINVASGNVDVALPDESAFTVDLEKMSGLFTCDFPQAQGVYGPAGRSSNADSVGSASSTDRATESAGGRSSANGDAHGSAAANARRNADALGNFDITIMSGQVTLRPR